MLPTDTTNANRPSSGSAAGRWDRWAPWGLAALLLYVLYSILRGWRYFPGFSGDHAWYLQVALRVSQGDVLYRDVAWAYGPLPAHLLAALFRWGGPDAAWASLINGGLTLAGVLLTYWAMRALLTPGMALFVTAFAAIAGSAPWHNLFTSHFYIYTPAVAWGGVASLVALVATLRWLDTGAGRWLLLAGVAAGLAMLSKPEFGFVALASFGAAALFGRGRMAGSWRFLLAFGLTLAIGFGLQARSSGIEPLWRGYSGYDQLIGGSAYLWGTRLGDRRVLLGGYALWLGFAALWAIRRWPRRRSMLLPLALACALAVAAVALSYGLGITRDALQALIRRGDASGFVVAPVNVLRLVSLPWAPLLPLLLGVAWLARKRSLPAAWWIIWSYAVFSSPRFLLTGHANPFAIAPALAVLWVWIEDRLSDHPQRVVRVHRVALAVLTGMALVNGIAQVAIPNPLLNGPRAWVNTALGPVRIPELGYDEYQALVAFIERSAPPDTSMFAMGWGAQWYLLTQRANLTAFDAWFVGLGTSGREGEEVERALLESPPAVVIMPSRWRLENDEGPVDARSPRLTMPEWWQTLQRDYIDQSPAEATRWRVLLHR